MKIDELILPYLNSYEKNAALTYFTQNPGLEVPDEMAEFIRIFREGTLINEVDFYSFSALFSTLDKRAKECVIHLICTLSNDIYAENLENINNAVQSIETNLSERGEIPKVPDEDVSKYLGLLNCYQLFAHHVSMRELHWSWTYPGLNGTRKRVVSHNIPLALNALRLVGKLPITDDFYGINLSSPFYPLHLDVVNREKVPLKKGVKDSDHYFPYKLINKIAQGDTGDNTFVATNGKKILFVRGVDSYSPTAILASKIATLVSSQHFSSERLLNNRLVGSKAIPGYAVSVADGATRQARKQYIEIDKKIFPGSGIIDEVTNFVNETDPNIENFGFSSQDIYQSHLTKIDFDHCSFGSQKTTENYEVDILTQPYAGIYHQAPHVQINPEYIKEKLFARLKLSMIPPGLFNSLASKAYTIEDDELKEEAVRECVNRSKIALELFFKHPKTRSFLAENPSIVNDCYQQITEYIATHFEPADQQLLQSRLRKQAEFITASIKKKINRKFASRLDPLPLIENQAPEDAQTITIKSQPIDAKQAPIAKDTQFNDILEVEPEFINKESTFLSRNFLKLLGIISFTGIGVIIGLTLTATGVLAPLGTGLLGFTVAAAIGLGAGLALGGATFGTKMAYDEYQYRLSKKVVISAPREELRPSSSIHELVSEISGCHNSMETTVRQREKKPVFNTQIPEENTAKLNEKFKVL